MLEMPERISSGERDTGRSVAMHEAPRIQPLSASDKAFQGDWKWVWPFSCSFRWSQLGLGRRHVPDLMGSGPQRAESISAPEVSGRTRAGYAQV